MLPLPSCERDPFAVHIIQVLYSEPVQHVIDWILKVRRASQPGAERVGETGQLAPRPSFVALVAYVWNHAIGKRPIGCDLSSERVGQFTPVGWHRLVVRRGQRKQQQDGHHGGARSHAGRTRHGVSILWHHHVGQYLSTPVVLRW